MISNSMGQHESLDVTSSSSQQGGLTPRVRERVKEREGERNTQKLNDIKKLCGCEENIMKLVQIKSGTAELPMKIFIIPQTFGYRGVWN